MIVDAHMHIWNRLHGLIGGKVPLVALGNGMIRIGDKALLGMPVTHADSTARAEWAVAEFDAAGVEVGVVVQEYMDGEQNDYCLEAQKRFPGRFFCHGLVNFFAREQVVREAEGLLAQGFQGIKLPGGHLAAGGVALDDPAFMPLWEKMEAGGIVLAVDLTEGEGQVGMMENILRHCPKLKVAVGHFGMVNREGWPGQLRLCRHENVYMESGGIVWLYRHEGWPLPGAVKAIREAIKEVGVKKLMWGSDWPRTMVDFTYRQSLDFVRLSGELNGEEKEWFLGRSAAALYGLEEKAERNPVALITEG